MQRLTCGNAFTKWKSLKAEWDMNSVDGLFMHLVTLVDNW